VSSTIARAEHELPDVLTTVQSIGVLPVLVVADVSDAVPLAHALLAGGVRCAEVTLRTPSAIDVIAAMSAESAMAVGAGTVLTAVQAESAVEAGAQYVVTPSFNASVVRTCQQMDVPVFPGVATATELHMALDAGTEVVKFFPAELCGGLPMIKALAEPFPSARFIPTGGIKAATMGSYLANRSVFAVGGSWLATRDLIRRHEYQTITRLCQEATSEVTRARAGGEGADVR
jgi:2-dehydro-3-deoxyphosphogluconate aldolase/(4S)-4-hydroxy-2-oxoglutarate aldolase